MPDTSAKQMILIIIKHWEAFIKYYCDFWLDCITFDLKASQGAIKRSPSLATWTRTNNAHYYLKHWEEFIKYYCDFWLDNAEQNVSLLI